MISVSCARSGQVDAVFYLMRNEETVLYSALITPAPPLVIYIIIILFSFLLSGRKILGEGPAPPSFTEFYNMLCVFLLIIFLID